MSVMILANYHNYSALMSVMVLANYHNCRTLMSVMTLANYHNCSALMSVMILANYHNCSALMSVMILAVRIADLGGELVANQSLPRVLETLDADLANRLAFERGIDIRFGSGRQAREAARRQGERRQLPKHLSV